MAASVQPALTLKKIFILPIQFIYMLHVILTSSDYFPEEC
jgi:hypothetical protein